MRLMKRRRLARNSGEPLDDPMANIANLFDVSIVFIVSMMIALFMAYNMMDLLDPNSTLTIVKESADGRLEIITKEGRRIRAERVTDRQLQGRGTRLGTAYKLEGGRVVYVPE